MIGDLSSRSIAKTHAQVCHIRPRELRTIASFQRVCLVFEEQLGPSGGMILLRLDSLLPDAILLIEPRRLRSPEWSRLLNVKVRLANGPCEHVSDSDIGIGTNGVLLLDPVLDLIGNAENHRLSVAQHPHSHTR